MTDNLTEQFSDKSIERLRSDQFTKVHITSESKAILTEKKREMDRYQWSS